MIDYNKPYGIISGLPGVHFEQDGKLYDNKGREIGGEKEEKVLVYPPAAEDGFKKREIINALEYLGLRHGKDFFKQYRIEKLLSILLKATELD